MSFNLNISFLRENQKLKEKLAKVVKKTKQFKATNDKLKNLEKQNTTKLTEITKQIMKKKLKIYKNY